MTDHQEAALAALTALALIVAAVAYRALFIGARRIAIPHRL